jgi:hypothetical protein
MIANRIAVPQTGQQLMYFHGSLWFDVLSVKQRN